MSDQTVDPGDSTPNNQSRPQRDTAPSGAAESVPQATPEPTAAGETSRSSSEGGANIAASSDGTSSGDGTNRPRRRRGSRGGRNRNRSSGGQGGGANASGMTTTRPARPILNVNPMSFPSARRRIVREMPLPPQMHS